MANLSYDQYKEIMDSPNLMGAVFLKLRRAGLAYMLEKYADRYRLEQSLPAIKAAIMGLSPSLTDH